MTERAADSEKQWLAANSAGATAQDEAVDQRLIAAVRNGDAAALDQLLRRHEAPVLRLVRLLGVGGDDREDVAQEIFVRVFRHLDGFKLGRSFRGWLYRVAVNAVHDHRHRLSRRSQRESPWSEALEQTPDSAQGPGESAVAREGARRLEDALQGLSERERAVFVLVELEGFSTRETGRSLGITAITVRRHLGRARASLRTILANDEKSS